MTFPKAYHGVKKLFTARMLGLIGSVCSIIGLIIGAGAAVSLVSGESDTLAIGAGSIVFIAAGLILPIIGLIIQLVGLKQAANDEDNFRQAFIISIFALVITIVSSIFTALNVGGGRADNIATLVSGIAEIFVVIYVTQGISNLADQLKNEDIARQSGRIAVLFTVVYAVSILSNFVIIFFGANQTIGVIVIVLSILSAILSFVASIIYLVYLGNAKNMLRDN